MLTLYHAWTSTCSQKVRLCLAEKDEAHRGVALDLRRLEHLDEAFLAINPAGMVPVLDDDGFVLTESSVINEYLDERSPSPALMPADARGRARVRAWVRFVDEVPTDAIKPPSYQRNLAGPLRALGDAQRALIRTRMPNRRTARRWLRIAETEAGLDEVEVNCAITRLTETLERMCSALDARSWLAGSRYTLADVAMVPFVDRLAGFEEFDLPRDWPTVHDWLARIRRRPAFARARFRDQRVAADTG